MPGYPQPHVSIVTPAYNAAEYLAECIESVVAQTYATWDYTIIDNCSTDGSAEIAQRYASKDPRIRVLTNSSVLRALANHNAALRQISPTSKYCKVVFADDWIFPECLEKMVDLAEAHPAIGIVGAYALEGQEVRRTGLPYSSTVFSGREICRQQLIGGLHVFGSPNGLLYRSDVVRRRESFYNEANIHADTEVCFEILKSCQFGFVHQVLTFTRVRPSCLSAVTAKFGSWFANILCILMTYGPDYLSPDELAAFLKRHLASYYRFLGKSLFLGRDKEFWAWHKKSLIEAGVGFSSRRLARGALEELCGAVLNPKHALGRLGKVRMEPRGETPDIL